MRIARIVKFRAFNKLTKRYSGIDYGWHEDKDEWWAQIDAVQIGSITSISESENWILEEFTGLRDCKRTEKYPEGQPIYEGDIIKDGEGIGVIRFHPGMAAFVVVVKENEVFWINPTALCRKDQQAKQLQYSEVIGNENENPELLEG